MRTSSHILAALTVITASSIAMNAIATTPMAPPAAPAKKTTCFQENATLSVNFNASETTAEAAIAFPENKIQEIETMLMQATADYTLQSMNYSVNKNRHSRHSQGNAEEWKINGSFNMKFGTIESAQKALIMMDNADFTPRLNVNKNKSHRCK